MFPTSPDPQQSFSAYLSRNFSRRCYSARSEFAAFGVLAASLDFCTIQCTEMSHERIPPKFKVKSEDPDCCQRGLSKEFLARNLCLTTKKRTGRKLRRQIALSPLGSSVLRPGTFGISDLSKTILANLALFTFSLIASISFSYITGSTGHNQTRTLLQARRRLFRRETFFLSPPFKKPFAVCRTGASY